MFPYAVLFEFYYTRMAHWRWHVLTDSVIATAAMASMMKKEHAQKQHIRENIVEKRNQIALWDLKNCSICYINFYCWPPRNTEAILVIQNSIKRNRSSDTLA